LKRHLRSLEDACRPGRPVASPYVVSYRTTRRIGPRGFKHSRLYVVAAADLGWVGVDRSKKRTRNLSSFPNAIWSKQIGRLFADTSAVSTVAYSYCCCCYGGDRSRNVAATSRKEGTEIDNDSSMSSLEMLLTVRRALTSADLSVLFYQ